MKGFDFIKVALTPVFQKYQIGQAILFGSFAKGVARQDSDVDLYVDSGLRGLKFVGFVEEIRKALGRDVDVFDVSHVEDGSLLEQEIKNTGVVIYG